MATIESRHRKCFLAIKCDLLATTNGDLKRLPHKDFFWPSKVTFGCDLKRSSQKVFFWHQRWPLVLVVTMKVVTNCHLWWWLKKVAIEIFFFATKGDLWWQLRKSPPNVTFRVDLKKSPHKVPFFGYQRWPLVATFERCHEKFFCHQIWPLVATMKVSIEVGLQYQKSPSVATFISFGHDFFVFGGDFCHHRTVTFGGDSFCHH